MRLDNIIFKDGITGRKYPVAEIFIESRRVKLVKSEKEQSPWYEQIVHVSHGTLAAIQPDGNAEILYL